MKIISMSETNSFQFIQRAELKHGNEAKLFLFPITKENFAKASSQRSREGNETSESSSSLASR